jgi:endonuclease/exonuclease/phosphatase family metal-dependent hydrolase
MISRPKSYLLVLSLSLCNLLSTQLEAQTPVVVQTNVVVRVMAANLNGNVQSWQPYALRILQGLKPDVAAVQEFNYNNNTAADFRSMVDTAFGTNFSYYREPYTANGNIPNGIISRYPIVASGSWADSQQSQPNRGFAWARIDIPGTNDLYVVSVHLLTRDAPTRASEANSLKALIQSNFPSNAWVIVAGDFNTDSRSEAALTNFKTFLSDNPIPADAESGGDADTNNGRSKPYDYVLPSFALANYLTPSVLASHSFSRGLVFDSRVYSPLGDVAPIQAADSGLGQHMAVLKDFKIPYSITNYVTNVVVASPYLLIASSNVIRWHGLSNVTYKVQVLTNLNFTNWMEVGTASSTTTNLSFTNTLGLNQGFFRVIYP